MQSHVVCGGGRVIVDVRDCPTFLGNGMEERGKLKLQIHPQEKALGGYGRGLWIDNGIGWGFAAYPTLLGVCYHFGADGRVVIPNTAPCASLVPNAQRIVVCRPPWGRFWSGTDAHLQVCDALSGRVEHTLEFVGLLRSVFRVMTRPDNVVWVGLGNGMVHAYDLHTIGVPLFKHDFQTGLYDILVSANGVILAGTSVHQGLRIYDTRAAHGWMRVLPPDMVDETLLAVTDREVCVRDECKCVAIDRRVNRISQQVWMSECERSVVWVNGRFVW
jgi:hypothetical protein